MSWMAIAGAIISGLGERSEGKRDQKNSRQQRQFDAEMLRWGADEERRTIEYSAELEDFYRRKQRQEKSQGWDNWFTSNKPANAPLVKPVASAYDRSNPDFEIN